MLETSYSPRLRTGLLLSGSGTAGAYQAGALRAILEAGIKIDVIAAHGAGVLTALAASVDGGARVWDAAGPWTDPRLRRAYRWRAALRWAFGGLLGAIVLLLSPLIVLVAAAAAYAFGELASLVGLTTLSTQSIGLYRRGVEALFDPPILPTILPRLLVLAVLTIGAVLAVSAIEAVRRERSRRRVVGAFWWRLIASPLDATEPSATAVETLWRLVRGASSEPRPAPGEIGRRYVDVLADNFGQPGFHEVLIAVHDLDARQDLVGAVLAAPARGEFEVRRPGAPPRESETVDFTGPLRETVVGFLMGALRPPVVAPAAVIEFPPSSYWRGERHRLCDRPELATRLVDEMAAIGVEQVIVISPAPAPATPHTLRAQPINLRARAGELVRSMETAVLSDTVSLCARRFASVFVVRPDHNPIGPFDFGGVYDEASDRRRTVSELIEQGHADAFHHLIEPLVSANERVG
ncbi:MAG: patatin-like phospholipase family protein [Acidobacteriota bacterium]